MENSVGQDKERPLVNIVCERVALGPLRRDLLPLYLRWINDLPAARNLNMLPPHTLEQEERWYESAAAVTDSKNFTIYEASTWRPIGTTDLGSINFQHRRAVFGIFIGEADCRGKGYGTETTRLMLDYAFTALWTAQRDAARLLVQQGRPARLREGGIPRVRSAARMLLLGRPPVGRRVHGVPRQRVHEPGPRARARAGRRKMMANALTP